MFTSTSNFIKYLFGASSQLATDNLPQQNLEDSSNHVELNQTIQSDLEYSVLSIDESYDNIDQSDSVNPSPLNDIKSFVDSRTFAEEIENDRDQGLSYVGRAESDDVLEAAGIEVYKRALAMIGAGDMQISRKGQADKSAAENLMPAASYLSHGARIMIEIPKGEGDSLFNWFTSGDQNKNGASNSKTQEDAMKEGKYFYNRYAATHGVDIQDGKAVETKGFLIGARDFVTSKGAELFSGFLKYTGLVPEFLTQTVDSYAVTNHYGLNLRLGVGEDGRDKAGHEVKGVDSDHGHLYVYYRSPTDEAPGAILFGIEGSAPDSPHHSKTGASDPYSPSYGSLWEKLEAKERGEEHGECVIGDKYNGRKISLSRAEINKLIDINVNDLNGEKLVTCIPSTSVESFLDNLNSEEPNRNFVKYEDSYLEAVEKNEDGAKSEVSEDSLSVYETGSDTENYTSDDSDLDEASFEFVEDESFDFVQRIPNNADDELSGDLDWDMVSNDDLI